MVIGVAGEVAVIAALADDLTGGIEPFFLGYGVLGAMFLLVMLGWLQPKWATDRLLKEIGIKDELIASQAASVKSLADNYERALNPRRRP